MVNKDSDGSSNSNKYGLSDMANSRVGSTNEVDKDDGAEEDLIIEIQIKVLKFNGVSSRLITIRNVNFIVEQQRLLTQSLYDRKLTNTLSHELLTPLNCITNLSDHLNEEVQEQVVKK